MHHNSISGAFASVQGITDVPAPVFEWSPDMAETSAGNGRVDVGLSSRNLPKPMFVQLFGSSESPFVLLSIPTSCSNQRQTPNYREQ